MNQAWKNFFKKKENRKEAPDERFLSLGRVDVQAATYTENLSINISDLQHLPTYTLLCGLAPKLLNKLQLVQNSTSCLLTQNPSPHHPRPPPSPLASH